MISQNRIKQINLLKNKKNRLKYNNFVAEGRKIVGELLKSNIKIEYIVATEHWIENNKLENISFEILTANDKELKKISSLTTTQEVLAVVEIPKTVFDKNEISENLSIVLDGIQDPGNLGTIIRLADWFGIKNVFCSPNTVDLYNSKVIQATMGAFLRVKVHYLDIENLISEYNKTSDFETFGTFMEGENIYKKNLPNKGFIVMGNEGNGISPAVSKLIDNKINIPNFSTNPEKTESLNVAIATAIVCSEFMKK